MLILILAIIVHALGSGAFFYIEAIQMQQPTFRDVIRYGTKPLVLAILVVVPFIIYWSGRVFYRYSDHRFWQAILICEVIASLTLLVCGYLGSKQLPTKYEIIGLVLVIIAMFVSRLK